MIGSNVKFVPVLMFQYVVTSNGVIGISDLQSLFSF